MNTTRTFKHFVRVPYAHTDQMRFVYYANYLVYFEMARAEMLREVGLPYAELEKQGLFLPVVEAHCEYKSPAHFDDRLEILSNCRIQGVRLRVEYKVSRESEAPRAKVRGIYAEPSEAKNAILPCGSLLRRSKASGCEGRELQSFAYSAVVKPLATKAGLAKEGELIVTGHTVHVCVSAALKIIRPPTCLQKLVMVI